MTRQELTHHVELKKQLAADLELLASLEAAGLATEAADIKPKIHQLEAETARSEAVIKDYISTIKDARTRMIFHLRFICGMTWKEVATTIGGISDSGVKAICYRYLARGGPARMGRPPKKPG